MRWLAFQRLSGTSMFLRESEMAPAVSAWLRAAGLRVKHEFVTPWGVCDLVALSFNQGRVDHRLQLRQSNPVSSHTRAIILLQVPDIETHQSTTADKLASDCYPVLSEDSIDRELHRLIADRFVVRSRTGRLQKVNGWMPLQERLVAVELKLTRIEEAMQQARSNLGLGAESYVAFPSAIARRVAANARRWQDYFDAGIGLLSVTKRTCVQLIAAGSSDTSFDLALQLYSVEKFWRTRLKDN